MDELTGLFDSYITTASWLEPSTVRAAYQFGNASLGELTAGLKGARNRVWTRSVIARNGSVSGGAFRSHYSLYDGADERLRFTFVFGAGGTYMKCEAVNGATLTTLIATTDADYPFYALTGSSAAFAGLAAFNIDVNYAAAGWVRIYNDDRLVGSFAGDPRVGGSAALTKAKIRSGTTAGSWAEWAVSGIIIGDEDTRGLKIVTHYANGAGDANTFSSGVYTAVDEIGESGTDFTESLAAGQKYLFNVLNVPAAWGTVDVRQVAVRSRVMAAASVGPTQVKQLVKTSATEVQGALKAPSSINYELVTDAWDINPVTGLAWTKADIDALQIGNLSVA